MKIPEEDRKQILEAGRFLEDKNFVAEWSDDLISYAKDNILIKIYYERYTFYSTVTIRFNDINKVYDVGRIAVVRTEIEANPHINLQHVLILLSYIEQNLEQVTSHEYCEESEKMLEELFEKAMGGS